MTLGGAFVIARCDQSQSRTETRLEAGLTALAQALKGAHARFDDAEVALAEAASNVIFDAYPLFCLEMTRILRGSGDTHPAPELAPIVGALRAGELAEALNLAASRPANDREGDLLVRLCSDLVRLGR
jgi:hypothetical protein